MVESSVERKQIESVWKISEEATAKQAALVAANKQAAQDILLDIKRRLDSQVTRVTKG